MNPFIFHKSFLLLLFVFTNFILMFCSQTVPYPPFIETVPYTNRRRIVLLSDEKEYTLGKIKFEEWKKSRNVVLVTDPLTIRVQLIFNKIVKEARREMKRSRHMDKLNWEISLIKEYNASYGGLCFGGGKIAINTESVWDESDNMIAAVVGHEVGHALARHHMDSFTERKFGHYPVLFRMALRRLVLSMFVPNLPDVSALSDIHVWFPLRRKKELEAQYIGLMLMASAGYDPEVAPRLYEGYPEKETHHPSGKKSVEYLNRPDIMGRALALYNKRERVSIPRQEFYLPRKLLHLVGS